MTSRATASNLAELRAAIRRTRRAARRSMGSVAEEAGISRTTMHRLENGRSRPTAGNVARVLVALGMRPRQVAAMVGQDPWGVAVLAWMTEQDAEPDRSEARCPDRWLRPHQAAAHFGVTIGGLAALKRAGLPHHKTARGTQCLYLEDEIARWSANRVRVPANPPAARPRRPRYQPRP